jgi:alpha-ketoglutarate-dependent taurine dioxygenase
MRMAVPTESLGRQGTPRNLERGRNVCAYPRERIEVPVDALGPEVSAWKAGAAIPPLFIVAREGAFPDNSNFIFWCREHRPELDRLILDHGAIVLRGFPMGCAADFNAFTSVFPTYEHGYVGGMSPRKKIQGNVLESTRLVETYKINLHSEMAYMRTYPPRVAFFCRQAATTGGETIIGSMHEFMKRLPAELTRKLEQHEVHIVRNFAAAGSTDGMAMIDHPDKVAWNDAFYTDSRAEVEQRCRQLGMKPIWNEDGSLTLLDVTKTFTVHPKTGERFYRNNLHTNRSFDRPGFREIEAAVRATQKHASGMYLDNGETLTADEAATINRIYEEIELAWPWQNGDVMVLDNLQVAHGRNTYSGPREIMVALFDN